MFKRVNKIFSLIIGNHLDSCKRDVVIFEKILKNYGAEIKICLDCYPEKELREYLQKKEIKTDDLLLVHYSGHGERVGKRIKGKVEVISTWINPDGTYVYSYIIDRLLSEINCNILLISDSCYSGSFGKFYDGKKPFIFIGSSNTVNTSDDYVFDGESTGALVNLFEHILKKTSIYELDINIIKSLSREFYKLHNIKIKPVILSYNSSLKNS